MSIIKGVNWNKPEDNFSEMFWDQNISQMWRETEIPVSDDIDTWLDLSELEQASFMKGLIKLTMLDTKQGGEGMPLIGVHTENLQQKSVFMFMAMMEEIHAKSYSHIFSTLASQKEINDLFEWSEKHPALQHQANEISSYYQKLLSVSPTQKERYMAMVASVFLEGFLFYSGFYYPLYLAGKGKLTHSGEVIKLILRDEAIHQLYTGTVAQQLFANFSPSEQAEIKKEVNELLIELYEKECEYTKEIYSELGLESDVLRYIRYNGNRAMQALGFDEIFEHENFNPIVLNSLSTDTAQHDFFSQKGDSYTFVTNIERLKKDDFNELRDLANGKTN